jgi:hypothetical protein
MKRPWHTAGLPEPAKATRRASGGWLVGAPTGDRELRSAVECGSVLPVPGAVHRQGTASGAGSQHRVRHTTQGTSVTTRLARINRWAWSPTGGPAAGTSRDLDELAVRPVRMEPDSGSSSPRPHQLRLTTRGSQQDEPGR